MAARVLRQSLFWTVSRMAGFVRLGEAWLSALISSGYQAKTLTQVRFLEKSGENQKIF